MKAPSRSAQPPRMEEMSPEALEQIAAYFQVLAESTRLRILNLLREHERNVGELAQLCGCSSANVSRHLALLTQHGLVTRTARGTNVYFQIADPAIYGLCDLVCGQIARRYERAADARSLFAPVGRG